MPAVKGVTTPRDLHGKKPGLVARVTVGEREGYWDLFRPLEQDCAVEVYDFDHKYGRHVSGL